MIFTFLNNQKEILLEKNDLLTKFKDEWQESLKIEQQKSEEEKYKLFKSLMDSFQNERATYEKKVNELQQFLHQATKVRL